MSEHVQIKKGDSVIDRMSYSSCSLCAKIEQIRICYQKKEKGLQQVKQNIKRHNKTHDMDKTHKQIYT